MQMYKVFFNDNILYFSEKQSVSNKIDVVLNFNDIQPSGLANELFYNGKSKSILVISDDFSNHWLEFQKQFKIIEAAGGIVRNQFGQYLFIKRRGKWDLPKGKCEKNESIEECAEREIEEECGISGLCMVNDILETYHTYELKGKLVLKRNHWYLFDYSGNESPKPQTEEDISEVIWAEEKDIPKIISNTYPSIIDVLEFSGITIR